VKHIAFVVALVALAQPALGQDTTQVQVNADGQITGVSRAEPAYFKYQYMPVQCVTLPCPNYFVLAAESPETDGIVVWSDEIPPEIAGPKKLTAAMRNLSDGPACWIIRGDLIIEEEGTTLRVDEVVGRCD
jgi:hypothetical protein